MKLVPGRLLGHGDWTQGADFAFQLSILGPN